MTDISESDIQQLADRVGSMCRAHPEAILDRKQWAKGDEEPQPIARLGLLGLAGSRWCSAADRAAILAESPSELCNPKTIGKIKSAFLKKAFCDMMDIDDDQYREGSAAIKAARSIDWTPSKPSKSPTPPTTPERSHNIRSISNASDSGSLMTQSKKLSPVASAFVSQTALISTRISHKFDPNKYGNPCFKEKLAKKLILSASPSLEVFVTPKVAQEVLPVNYPYCARVEAQEISMSPLATCTSHQHATTVVELAEAVGQVAEATSIYIRESIENAASQAVSLSIASPSLKTDIKQRTSFVRAFVHSTCNPRNGLAESLPFISSTKAAPTEENTHSSTSNQFEDPAIIIETTSTILNTINSPQTIFPPSLEAIANQELSMDFQKKMAGFDRNKYGNPCFKKAPVSKPTMTISGADNGGSQINTEIQSKYLTAGLEIATPIVNGVTYTSSAFAANPPPENYAPAFLAHINTNSLIVTFPPNDNANSETITHNTANQEENGKSIDSTEPAEDPAAVITQAPSTISYTRIVDKVANSVTSKSDGRWPHPAFALDAAALMKGAEYISQTILSELKEAHANGNTNELASNLSHNVNVKYVNNAGYEDFNPKEGIRAIGGTERDLIDFDGSMAPAPCDWEDARPPLDPEFKPTYIDEWRMKLPCGNAFCVNIKCPDFMDGQHPINNTVLDSPVRQPESKPDIEGAENRVKRLKQTAGIDSLLRCAKIAKKELEDKLDRESHVKAQAEIAKVVEHQEEINTYRPLIVSYVRPVEDKDAAAIQKIYNHYVKHSIITEDQEEISTSDAKALIGFAGDQKLPFIVAISGRCPAISEVPYRSGRSEVTLPEREEIVGFSFAERVNYGFSGKVNGRSRFSAGLQLFVHPQYTRKGFARNLMDRMMYILNPMHSFHNATPWVSPRNDPVYESGGAGKFHQIIFQIPLEKQNDPNYSWVSKFLYTGFWFKEGARLISFARTSVKQNGKHPRFIDLAILQSDLLHPSEFESY